ncbi:MAG TPA: hypothetical protein VKS79_24460 [Gemmataceae bacterium]|nr:hypothetical protein [Gemmataceae bacterium]
MATGRDNQLAKQVGEYLVAAEAARLGLIATTFTGNVPHFDILACNLKGAHRTIQVKAIRRSAWQFDVRQFADVQLEGKSQIIGRPATPPCPGLICVLVRIGEKHGTDEFYIMTWEDLRAIIIGHYRDYLAKCGGIRPKKFDSYHVALQPKEIAPHRDKWELLVEGLVKVKIGG